MGKEMRIRMRIVFSWCLLRVNVVLFAFLLPVFLNHRDQLAWSRRTLAPHLSHRGDFVLRAITAAGTEFQF